MDFKSIIIQVLLLLVLLILNVSVMAVGGKRISTLSKDEDLEFERQLKILNKPPIKIIRTKSGDIFDCVDIYKQPAFDNPLLKNHKIQMKPNIISDEETGLVSRSGPSQNVKYVKTGLEVHGEKCPPETVPIRRTTKKDLVNAKYHLHKPNPNPNPKPDGIFPFQSMPYHHKSLSTTDDGVHYGGKAYIGLHNPNTDPDQFTTSQIWVQNGPKFDMNSVEVGWTVYPFLYGDNRTRFFSFWTSDGYEKNGCYNMLCTGFVQIDSTVTFGDEFDHVSVYDGDQYGLIVMIYKLIDRIQIQTGNWWLTTGEENKQVGYWPKELFNYLSENATIIRFGGVMGAPPKRPTPPMGNGHFPDKHYKRVAYMSNMKVVDKNGSAIDFDDSQVAIVGDTMLQCYGIQFAGRDGDYMELSMVYGGPGGFCYF